jgi:phage repressor protein C with HTH and peptisase S24 domain
VTVLGDLVKARRTAKGWTQKQLALAAGYGQTGIDQIEQGTVVGPRRWHGIADALEIPREEFRQAMLQSAKDTPRQRVSRALPELRPNARVGGPANFSARQIPVYGQAVGGAFGEYIFNGEAVDWAPCPPLLDNVAEAYAVFVDGESMAPRYDPRDTLWVHPSKPPRPGDDVVVQIAVNEDGPPHGYVKRFVGWSGSKLKLRQLNPDKEISFDRAKVVSVHSIVGVLRG